MSTRRVPFVPNPKAYKDFYRGSGFPVFKGVYQDGSGLIGDIFRNVVPILKPIAINAGKTLLKSGANVLKDVISGDRDLKTALRQRGMEGLKEVGKDILNPIVGQTTQVEQQQQQEGGLYRRGRRRRKRTNSDTSDIFDLVCRKPRAKRRKKTR
jgi:hypothetical protein